MRKFLILTACTALLASRSAIAADRSLDSSETLFTMLAALNAAGYNLGMDSPDNSPLRRQIRDYLAQQKIPVLKEIRDFYVYKNPSVAPYISLALSVTGPPDFPYRTRTLEVPPDALALEPFVVLLQRFYQEANIADLWKRVQPAYDAEIERYHEPITNIALVVNSYMRNVSGGIMGRHLQFYFDLLAAPNQIQSRSYGNDYFVVITPAKTPNIFEIRHAYLHYVVEPLAAKASREIMQSAALSDYVATAPGLEESYKNDFILLAIESLIKALESRLDKNPSGIDRAFREGYILTPFFNERLAEYEKQPTAMRLFFPEMIGALDAAKERRRIENVIFTAKPKAPVVNPAGVAAEPAAAPLTAAGKLLEAGEAAFSKKEYDKALGFYLKVLDEKGSSAEHARAYYGLARLKLVQPKPDPEMAEELFQKTVDSAPDPQTLAWAQVYLGRLWDSQGDRDQAVKHYQAALDVKGASDQAHQAAEKEIQEPLTKPRKQ